MKKVIIINKFGPYSKAITGQNAREIADFLYANDLEVTYLCLSSEYGPVKTNMEQQASAFKVVALRELYKGTTSYLRFLFGFFDGFRLWLASLKQKADIAIVMTDPPLLIFWFQLFRRLSARKLFYWTMDVYPEAFVAGKYIRPGNIFYRFFSFVVYRRIPDLAIALGDNQLEYLEKKFKKPLSHVILPCGIIERNGSRNGEMDNQDKITFCYGGNIGEAHNADFLVSFINQLDPQCHLMIVSLYGSKADYVKKLISNSEVVRFRDFLTQSDIASMDVNVATLLPEWNHICVPSKAVTAICCGSSLLLNATKEADAWSMFKDAGWLVEAGENYKAETIKTITSITRKEIDLKKGRAVELAKKMVKRKMVALNDIVFAIKSPGRSMSTKDHSQN